MDKQFHNLLKDNLDSVYEIRDKYFNGLSLTPLYNYERNELTGVYEDVVNELEVNVNCHMYICFVKNDDKIYLRHYNLAQNNGGKKNNGGGKMKFHVEKHTFTNWYMTLKWLSSSHLYKPSQKKDIFDLLKK